MYNRYIPQPDGTYRRNRMQDPGRRPGDSAASTAATATDTSGAATLPGASGTAEAALGLSAPAASQGF